ncbi:type VI secretion system-associated FHA domain protein TagH [Algicola sagamiensis]|uniref:type VI secretion system-associated FHA domain protein TagH n=1 Tax=Algicola sagamiensis TaxID=163869 RepID=UPI0003709ACE|nr:type VI secretion system-associated FHA domain protein TagH [Algicola sagamiensis]
MEAILRITSYHQQSLDIEKEKRVNQTITLGRSASSDWHLPDPEKIISSQHAMIEQAPAGGFLLHDTSTNGTFINHQVSPIGKGNQYLLESGDSIRIGDYELIFEIQQTNAIPHASASQNEFTASNDFDASSSYNNSDDFGLSPSVVALEQALDPAPIDEAFHQTVETQIGSQSDPIYIPEDWNLAFSPEPAEAPSVPDQESSPTFSQPATPAPVKEPSQSGSQPIAPVTQSTGSNDDPCVQAFLRGLQVSDSVCDELNSPEVWQEMGQCMSLLFEGVIASLRHRNEIKQELKLSHTMFQAEQNNPLKFSGNVDDAFQNLFTRRSRSFLPPAASIEEAFKDTRDHDTALLAGTLGAIKGMLETLSPQQLGTKATEQLSFAKILPNQQQATSWRLYQSLYADLMQDIEQNGTKALSDDFVKAYDEKLHNL